MYRLLDDTLAQLVHNTLLDCCTPECEHCGLDVDTPVVMTDGDELHVFCSEECSRYTATLDNKPYSKSL
jgi:hypothetical protein